MKNNGLKDVYNQYICTNCKMYLIGNKNILDIVSGSERVRLSTRKDGQSKLGASELPDIEPEIKAGVG